MAKTSDRLILIRGDDPVLIGRALQTTVEALLGDEDRSLVVEELTEANYLNGDGVHEITPLVDAAQTPPFLTSQRIVIGRHLGLFTKADQVGALGRYLSDPLPTTAMVLVWEKGTDQQRLGAMPKSLSAIVEGSATIVDARVGRGKAADGWLDQQITDSGASLDRSARKALADRIGENRSRVPAILDTVIAAFGAAEVSAVDIEPYLGEAGDVAPWELTDAIASGAVSVALDKLHRMQRAGGRHSLQIMATLHGHYGRLLRLDGSGIRDEKGAAAVLGIKGSTFPAKKAMQEGTRMGSARVHQAISLLAAADLDVRGATATPDDATMEVLVARLTRLHR